MKSISAAAELDVVFPVLHGTFSEDGTIQGFFEMADIAYAGAGVLGSSVGMDKGVFKDVMRANSIPVVDWIVCTRKDVEKDINAIIHQAEQLFPLSCFYQTRQPGFICRRFQSAEPLRSDGGHPGCRALRPAHPDRKRA